ncbi:MAG: PAS domain-containing protein [Clostridia bacterium]|nr:PAS domain-containing protein [Clostridia bacterium]
MEAPVNCVLSASEQASLLNSILQASKCDIMYLDSSLVLRALNAKCAERAGGSAASFIGRRLTDAFPHFYVAVKDALFEAQRSGNPIPERSLRMITDSGERDYECSIIPIHEDGRFTGWIVFKRDPMQRPDADCVAQQIPEGQDAMADFIGSMVNAAPVGTAIINASSLRYQAVNSRFTAMAGISTPASKLRGVAVRETLHKHNSGVTHSLIKETIETGRRISVCTYSSAPERVLGYTCWTVDYIPISGPSSGTASVMVTVSDITEQVSSMRKQESLAAIAHDLNRGNDLSKALAATGSKCAAMLSADYFSLFLDTPSSDSPYAFVESSASGWKPDLTPDIAQACLKQVMESSRPIYYAAREAAAGDHALLQVAGAQRALCAPLISLGKFLGMLTFLFRSEGPELTPEDMSYVGLVAEQCSMAIAREGAFAEQARFLAAEQEARAIAQHSAETMAALLQSFEDGVIIFDGSGNLVLANPNAQRLTGLSPQEFGRMLVSSSAEMVSLDGSEVLETEMPYRKLVDGRSVANDEYLVSCGDGQRRILSFSGGVLRDPDGRVTSAIITFRDTTDIHELEQTKEEYVRIVSHDLRTPLTLIMARAQMALKMTDRPDAVHAHADAIVKAARNANSMISDLTESSRIYSRQLHLRKGLSDLVMFLRDLMERSADSPGFHRVALHLPAERLMVDMDSARVERMVMNLVSNALKYSPSDSEVLVSVARNGNEAVVSVVDKGDGVSPEDAVRIFEKYYRSREARDRCEGLGLGLYITKALVEAHGGRIWLTSALGAGSTFTFALPLEEDPR